MARLSHSFFTRPDVVQISKDLLGKFLFTRLKEQQPTGGMIVETEAYGGITDRASHAYANRRTSRTDVMYRHGGIAYVYLCYGIHSLFNIITNEKEIPHAILIRAIEPVEGIEIMLKRRKKKHLNRSLTAGPGALTEALGIKCRHTGQSVLSENIWIEDRGIKITEDQMIASPRVGVDYAGVDARLPWRFRIRGNPWTSKAK